jgi:transposase
MFLRKNRRTKNGKPHFYWSLVETIRTPKGPRQRVIGYLGDLNEEKEDQYRGLVKRLEGKPDGQLSLYRPFPSGNAVSVMPEKIRVEKVRDFGDAWVGIGFWKLLELDQFFSQKIESGKEEIPWETMISFLTVSRFCEAMSKLSIAERFADQSALSDILGIDSLKVNKDRLYRSMDQMLPCKQALGEHLKKRYGELFHLDYELFLYDMTSTYFEGQCPQNPQAKRGYSRDQRPDCKQVTLALVITKEGLPLFFEIFDGNRRDVTTVEEVVEYVESIYGRTQRVWVMDRGMVSEENLEWFRERQTAYLVGTPKGMLKQFEKHLLDREWEQVHPDVEVKLAESPEYQKEIFIVCRSASRREKEKAMTELFSGRIEKGLQKLREAIARKKRPLTNRDKLQRKIGVLLKINSRSARLFEVTVTEKGGRLNLIWDKRKQNDEWSDLSAGCYLLRSHLTERMTASDLWKAYMELTEVENAFRITKQDLGIRPVRHHWEERVQAHIFICFLSLVLQRTLEQGLVSRGLGRSTRKVLEELRGLKSMDVILPTTAGDELKLKIISEPDPALKILLDHLNLKCPKRLTPPLNVVEKINSPLKENQLLSPLLIP